MFSIKNRDFETFDIRDLKSMEVKSQILIKINTEVLNTGTFDLLLILSLGNKRV